ncbi:MAG: BrnA antitoxin family protein [Burkholderiales bacterium]
MRKQEAARVSALQPRGCCLFKSTGEGWQSRMDGVLRKYVARHSRSA